MLFISNFHSIEISEQRISEKIVQSAEKKIVVETHDDRFYHWLYHRMHRPVFVRLHQQRCFDDDQYPPSKYRPNIGLARQSKVKL